MRHGWLAFPLALVACSSADAPSQSVTYSTADDTLELQVELRWSPGEGDEWDLDEAVVYDEDEGDYGWSGLVVLGPISECDKPAADRAPDASCSWDGPSNAWNIELDLRAGGRFDVEFWAGDYDTDGGMSLPAKAVPTSSLGPLVVTLSPDNASGGWGHVRAAIARLDGDAPVDGDVPTEDEQPNETTCCVTCSSGVACGDACIPAGDTCHQSPGCACQG